MDPKKEKENAPAPEAQTLLAERLQWEATYHFHMVPDTFQPSLSLPLSLGWGKRRTAELPHPVHKIPESLNIVIQSWDAYEIKNEAGE